jgi:hypothetical protein
MANTDLGKGERDDGQNSNTWPFNRILGSRRAVTALAAIGCLFVLGLVNKMDTSVSIASVAAAMIAGNAYQKRSEP